MQSGEVVLLLSAGVAGGIVNALAGGATLITFPAMLAAGLPAVTANASNAVAISPGHLLAALADRQKLPSPDRRVVIYVLVALLGGLAGALVLLWLPERLFIRPVPVLIGFATLLFALAPRLQRHRRETNAVAPLGPSAMAVAAACLYGGFFGAGLGVILTAALSITEDGDIRTVKALKNLLGTCVAAAATATFTCQGAVRWPETATMLAGAMAGGYLGGHLIRVLPATVVRSIVVAGGIVLTVLYADRFWFSAAGPAGQ
jgi:hypothetical protein